MRYSCACTHTFTHTHKIIFFLTQKLNKSRPWASLLMMEEEHEVKQESEEHGVRMSRRRGETEHGIEYG